MSRSIGDWDAKRVGVISEPIVDITMLDDVDEQDRVFGESATHDMLDCTSLESVATRVRDVITNEFTDLHSNNTSK